MPWGFGARNALESGFSLVVVGGLRVTVATPSSAAGRVDERPRNWLLGHRMWLMQEQFSRLVKMAAPVANRAWSAET